MVFRIAFCYGVSDIYHNKMQYTGDGEEWEGEEWDEGRDTLPGMPVNPAIPEE